MKTIRVNHSTVYRYNCPVRFGEHRMESIAQPPKLKPLRNQQPSDSMGEIGGRVLRDAA
jgi:hypothetical protein